jgi:hypothetical protein
VTRGPLGGAGAAADEDGEGGSATLPDPGPTGACRLIHIEIEGRSCLVPAGDTVLRALQFLDIDLHSCRLCWNGDCDNCTVEIHDPATGRHAVVRACETPAAPGMRILRLPAQARWPAAPRP